MTHNQIVRESHVTMSKLSALSGSEVKFDLHQGCQAGWQVLCNFPFRTVYAKMTRFDYSMLYLRKKYWLYFYVVINLNFTKNHYSVIVTAGLSGSSSDWCPDSELRLVPIT